MHLTRKTSRLVKANYPPLLKSLQIEINRLSHNEHSWLGWIVLYKMLILPKILYILRTLPIPIPGSIFSQLHKQMNRSIRQNKKPWLSFALMNKHFHMVSLGLPNLQAYNFAVTMDQIKYWWHRSPDKQWAVMEANMIKVSN